VDGIKYLELYRNTMEEYDIKEYNKMELVRRV